MARVVVIDSRDRVLLFDTQLPYTRVWMTPGGGVKPGETHEVAAIRELWEETGISNVAIGACVWRVCFRFERSGVVYDQDERYFVVRIESGDVDRANLEPNEKHEIREARWWTLEQITASSADFRPRSLASLLPAVLLGEYPKEPLLAHVEASARVIDR